MTARQQPARPASPAAELADEFGRTGKVLGARLSERLAGHGLSMPRANILVELARNGPMRITRIGHRLGITQGTASTLAEALVRSGHVERLADPADGRVTQLAITDAGAQLAHVWRRDYERAAEDVFGSLSPEQRTTLLDLLRILHADQADQAG